MKDVYLLFNSAGTLESASQNTRNVLFLDVTTDNSWNSYLSPSFNQNKRILFEKSGLRGLTWTYFFP